MDALVIGKGSYFKLTSSLESPQYRHHSKVVGGFITDDASNYQKSKQTVKENEKIVVGEHSSLSEGLRSVNSSKVYGAMG
jgi:hypothetical protein